MTGSRVPLDPNEARTLTIDYIEAEIREIAEDLLLNDSPEDPASEADKNWAALLARRISARWASHRDATVADDPALAALPVPAATERPDVDAIILRLRRERVFEPYPEATHLVRLDGAEAAVREAAALPVPAAYNRERVSYATYPDGLTPSPDWVKAIRAGFRHSSDDIIEAVVTGRNPYARATTARPRRSAAITADEWAESLPVPLPIDAPKPSRNVRWGARADDPPTEIHNDPEKTRAYLAGLAAGRSEKLVTTDHPGRPDGTSVPDQTRRIVVYDARHGRGGLDVPVGCTVGEAALLAAEMFGVRVGPNDRPSFGLRGTGLHPSDPLPDDEDYDLFVIGGTV